MWVQGASSRAGVQGVRFRGFRVSRGVEVWGGAGSAAGKRVEGAGGLRFMAQEGSGLKLAVSLMLIAGGIWHRDVPTRGNLAGGTVSTHSVQLDTYIYQNGHKRCQAVATYTELIAAHCHYKRTAASHSTTPNKPPLQQPPTDYQTIDQKPSCSPHSLGPLTPIPRILQGRRVPAGNFHSARTFTNVPPPRWQCNTFPTVHNYSRKCTPSLPALPKPLHTSNGVTTTQPHNHTRISSDLSAYTSTWRPLTGSTPHPPSSPKRAAQSPPDPAAAHTLQTAVPPPPPPRRAPAAACAAAWLLRPRPLPVQLPSPPPASPIPSASVECGGMCGVCAGVCTVVCAGVFATEAVSHRWQLKEPHCGEPYHHGVE